MFFNANPPLRDYGTAIFAGAGVLAAYVWASDPSSGFNMKCDLHKSIKQRFDREGIAIAYHHRVVYLRENFSSHLLNPHGASSPS